MMVTLSLVFFASASCMSKWPKLGFKESDERMAHAENKSNIVTMVHEKKGVGGWVEARAGSQASDAERQPSMCDTASASLTTSHNPSQATMSQRSSGASAIS
jgi:hypothetical protein